VLEQILALQTDEVAIRRARRGVELFPRLAPTKAYAFEQLARAHGLAAAIVCGDDLTDFEMFRAARRMYGERALVVLVRSRETPRTDFEPDLVVDGVHGVDHLLLAIIHALTPPQLPAQHGEAAVRRAAQGLPPTPVAVSNAARLRSGEGL
jgi:trehalose-6-phosphatase